MAAPPTTREIGDYVINMDIQKCLGRTPKVYVYPGKHKQLKTKVAGKVFVWEKDLPTELVDREIENMKAIPAHENVLKLLAHDTIEVGDFKEIWLILELCEHGHLGKFAKNNQLTLAQKIDLMLQSGKGVQHLHHMEKAMVHRDLKPENLLVTGDRKHPLLKVADMGESSYFQGAHEYSVRHTTARGTPSYQAPELFSDPKSNKPKQNKAVDIYALGMSFLELLETEKDVDKSTFKVDEEVLGFHIHNNPDKDVHQLLSKPSDSDDAKMVKHLIAEMLAREPNSRPLIDDVVERLRQLRTLLGVKVLVSVDTVWEKPVFFLDSDLMDKVRTSSSKQSSETTDPELSSETTDPKPVTIDPPKKNDTMRMEHARRVISTAQDLLDELRKVCMKGDTEGEQSMAMRVFGGDRGVYVHEGAEWERVNDVLRECPGYGVSMCSVRDGAIVCGGNDVGYGPPVSQCHHFSVLTRQWRKLHDMLTPRESASAVEYDDMKVLVAGGKDSSGVSAVCEILDCENNQWSETANMPQPLESPLLAADSGRAFMLPRDRNLKEARLLVYDPSAQTGVSAGASSALPTDVRNTQGVCLVAAAHKLYLLGGEQGLALEYDPLTDQWQHLTPPSLTYSSYHGCCASCTSEHINVYGGRSAAGESKRNMVEVYNMHTQEWQKSDMRLPIVFAYYDCLVAHYSV